MLSDREAFSKVGSFEDPCLLHMAQHIMNSCSSTAVLTTNTSMRHTR